MLKITLDDSSAELCLRLEGRLSGPWVQELRQCWRTGASTTAGRRTAVDLREVDFIDAEGQALLCEMYGAKVELRANTPLIRSLVEEICRPSGCVRVEEKPASNAVFLPDSPRSHSGAV